MVVAWVGSRARSNRIVRVRAHTLVAPAIDLSPAIETFRWNRTRLTAKTTYSICNLLLDIRNTQHVRRKTQIGVPADKRVDPVETRADLDAHGENQNLDIEIDV